METRFLYGKATICCFSTKIRRRKFASRLRRVDTRNIFCTVTHATAKTKRGPTTKQSGHRCKLFSHLCSLFFATVQRRRNKKKTIFSGNFYYCVKNLFFSKTPRFHVIFQQFCLAHPNLCFFGFSNTFLRFCFKFFSCNPVRNVDAKR